MVVVQFGILMMVLHRVRPGFPRSSPRAKAALQEVQRRHKSLAPRINASVRADSAVLEADNAALHIA